MCSASAETRRPTTPTTPCPRVGWALYDIGNEHLKNGAAWLLKSNWDTAYAIQCDVAGEGMGHDIAAFGADESVASLEQDREEAAKRLERLKYLPVTRWREVFETETQEEEE